MEMKVCCTVKSRIPTLNSFFNLFYYKSTDSSYHLAISFNNNQSTTLNQSGNILAGANSVKPNDTVEECVVRIHSCCLTGEILGSVRCDCGEQLKESMKELEKNRGILIYLNQEGRGIGLEDKLLAYNLIDKGFDTLSANVELGRGGDEREYSVAAEMLLDLGIKRVILLTNNLDKVKGLEDNGIKVVSRIGLLPKDWSSSNGGMRERDFYLMTKRDKMGHVLPLPLHIESLVSGHGQDVDESTSPKFNHDKADQVDRYDHVKIVSCLENNQS